MWGHLFKPAPTVFEAYSNTANALNALRGQKIKNALAQIELEGAPELKRQELEQGKYKTSILGTQAEYEPKFSASKLQGMGLSNQAQAISNQYAPMMKQLQIQGHQLENAIRSEKFKYLPDELKLSLKEKLARVEQAEQNLKYNPLLQEAKIAQLIQRAQPKPEFMEAINPVAREIVKIPKFSAQVQQQMPTNVPPQVGASQLGAPYSREAIQRSEAQAQLSQQGAPPPVQQVPGEPTELIVPSGIKLPGGRYASYKNTKTGESYTPMDGQQIRNYQNRLAAFDAMMPLLNDMEYFGKQATYGATSGLPTWLGGEGQAASVAYKTATDLSVEHFMTIANMPKTDKTTHMTESIMQRHRWESPDSYEKRINAFRNKFKHLRESTVKSLELGLIPLKEQNEMKGFYLEEYRKAMKGGDLSEKEINKNIKDVSRELGQGYEGKQPSMEAMSQRITVRSPSGKLGSISRENLKEALSAGYREVK